MDAGWHDHGRQHVYAEYRDRDFLRCIGHIDLADALTEFWPTRGPQWDALGRTNTEEVIPVEAKAHIEEIVFIRQPSVN